MSHVRLIHGVTLCVLVLLLTPAPAWSADTDPVPAVSVAKGTVVRGVSGVRGAYEFAGRGFAPNTPIVVGADGRRSATTTSSPLGTFGIALSLSGSRPIALTAAGKDPQGLPRVVTGVASPDLPMNRSEGGRASDVPTRVYTNLLAGLAVVLLGVTAAYCAQAVRRRPSPGL